MKYLAMIEPLLFWSGLLIFLVSLVIYAGRTRDYRSLVMFWQPTISFNRTEFMINRTGLSLMVLAVLIRLFLFFYLG